MKIDVSIILGVFKLFIGAIALFLVLFGIHWMAILSGVILCILLRLPGRHAKNSHLNETGIANNFEKK